MKLRNVILLLCSVILVIDYTSAAGCKPKAKCKDKGGKCFASNKCRSGFKEIRKGCKGNRCSCCAKVTQGCKCGKANPNRIVGGQEVSPKYKYPWMVWIEYEDFYHCGGSIINDRYILTAAHCLHNYYDCRTFKPSTLKVVVADHNKDSTNDDSSVTKTLSVEKVILHNSYSCSALANDIGLLRLSKKLDISFSQKVRPVCLPQDDSKTYVGKQSVVTGWGYTTSGGPEIPSLLQEVTVPVIKCPDFDEDGQQLLSTMLCAGKNDGGLDSCNGDSGGPLVVKEGSQYVQVGIVSFGPIDCAGPGIYTRVSKYLTWIKNKMDNAKTCSRRASAGALEGSIIGPFKQHYNNINETKMNTRTPRKENIRRITPRIKHNTRTSQKKSIRRIRPRIKHKSF